MRDAELLLDGKAFRPDGKSAATLIPPAFGLAGVNMHTWTGWGSVTHWNAFVANLEMQGSGTFSVEAAIGTLVPRVQGHVLVPVNGAYCQRIARICQVLGRRLTTLDYAEDAPVRAHDVERALQRDPSITHVALVHCETSTGILNPLHDAGVGIFAISTFDTDYVLVKR